MTFKVVIETVPFLIPETARGFKQKGKVNL